MVSIFGDYKFVTLSWSCKRQTAVSHSSTEVEVISFDASMRMEELLALTLRDIVINVLQLVKRSLLQLVSTLLVLRVTSSC